jgi:hypothetical protein
LNDYTGFGDFVPGTHAALEGKKEGEETQVKRANFGSYFSCRGSGRDLLKEARDRGEIFYKDISYSLD